MIDHMLIQDSFVRWLDEVRCALAVPVRIESRTRDGIELAFEGVTSAVSAVVTESEINVYAEWEGYCWDILLSLDAAPEATATGYVCALCEPSARAVFETPDQLWRDHLFDPFRDWINQELASATCLGLFGSPGGTTWAKLMRAEDLLNGNRPEFLIPLSPQEAPAPS